MRKYSILLISAVLALAGCKKDNAPEENLSDKYPVFSTSMEDITKTELGAGNTVVWKLTDRVGVFLAGGTKLLEYKPNTEGEVCTELIPVSETNTESSVSSNVAFYPYSSSLSCTETTGVEEGAASTFTVKTSVPQTQTYKAGSFGADASPMMAVSASGDNVFKFKNVFGCLKLQFTGSGTVKTITVKGNNTENPEVLAGDISVSMTQNGRPTFIFDGTTYTSVTLDCGAGVTLSDTPTPFYISLPVVEFTKGITVSVEMDGADTPYSIATGGSLPIERSAIQPMTTCKLVALTTEEVSKPFTVKFCNSCYAYIRSNITVNTSGREIGVGVDGSEYSKNYSLYGPTRYYEHGNADPYNFWGGMGSYSPKNLVDGNYATGWTSLHGSSGTLCQSTDKGTETKFDDYDYSWSKLESQFHAFGGRRVQVTIVVDLKESCNIASVGLVNWDPSLKDGRIQSVEFYVSDDADFDFTPAYGAGKYSDTVISTSTYEFSEYGNPSKNNWTLIAKTNNLGVSTSNDKDGVRWVNVPYAMISSGKSKGRLLKIRFLETIDKENRTGYSATELCVKKATNL